MTEPNLVLRTLKRIVDPATREGRIRAATLSLLYLGFLIFGSVYWFPQVILIGTAGVAIGVLLAFIALAALFLLAGVLEGGVHWVITGKVESSIFKWMES